MENTALTDAKRNKNDEFYTQYEDIEKEINAYLDYDPNVFRDKTILLPCDDPEWSNFTRYFAQNFERFGLKKLISTSYAPQSKPDLFTHEPTPMETGSAKFDPQKTETRGKLFVVDRDINKDGQININDLDWDYLEGDGDFRSDEVTALRDEADVVVTNPPFSLFREHLAWLVDGECLFSVIGNMNAITYRDVFPLIKDNRLWFGPSIKSGDREFGVPNSYPLNAAGTRIDSNGNKFIRVKGVRWFTNIEHGRRHQPIPLMTMADNLKFNKRLIKKLDGGDSYQQYDNYDAIEVPFVHAIPSDRNGAMGVPITFLDKYCPEQFEILDANDFRTNDTVNTKPHGLIKDKDGTVVGDPKPRYARVLIRSIQ